MQLHVTLVLEAASLRYVVVVGSGPGWVYTMVCGPSRAMMFSIGHRVWAEPN